MTDLGHAGAGLDDEVRALVEQSRDAIGILGRVAEVGADEDRPAAPAHAPLELRVDLVPARPLATSIAARAVEAPARMRGELRVTLVVGRWRSKKRLRVTGVDQDRQVMIGGGIEDDI